jgi:CBS domain-containing protein
MHADALRVKDFMARDMLTVTPDTDIMRAIVMFTEHDISGMPVVDERGALVGILTERDIIVAALNAGYHDETGGAVQNFMSTPVETVSPDDSLLDVADFFARSPMRRCPVVADGRLVGLISRRDVLRALSDGAWFAAPQ